MGKVFDAAAVMPEDGKRKCPEVPLYVARSVSAANVTTSGAFWIIAIPIGVGEGYEHQRLCNGTKDQAGKVYRTKGDSIAIHPMNKCILRE